MPCGSIWTLEHSKKKLAALRYRLLDVMKRVTLFALRLGTNRGAFDTPVRECDPLPVLVPWIIQSHRISAP